jgi:hypothetical protein
MNPIKVLKDVLPDLVAIMNRADEHLQQIIQKQNEQTEILRQIKDSLKDNPKHNDYNNNNILT